VTPRIVPPETHSGRVERALYFRCRRGEPAALATFAYRLMDRLYTAASFVAPDEASATTAVLLAWEDALALLARLRVGGNLRGKTMRRLGRRLMDYADRATVHRALENAAHEDEEALLPMPDETVPALVEAAQRHAPDIAAAFHERQGLRRPVLQSLGAACLLVLLYAGWLYAAPALASQELELKCLQQRIVRQELVEGLRDVGATLPDPDGADYVQARVLQQASLVLEEVVNAASRQQLRYLVPRVEAEELPERLAEIAAAYEGSPRQELMQTQLVLEEVQAL